MDVVEDLVERLKMNKFLPSNTPSLVANDDMEIQRRTPDSELLDVITTVSNVTFLFSTQTK